MKRKFGILQPIFSLWGDYGIGSFGKPAYEFIDFLAESGVSAWQVLPLCPVGAGASPYSSPAGDAINPFFIDLDILYQKGLLTKSELSSAEDKIAHRVDYDKLFCERIKLLNKAFSKCESPKNVTPYAVFDALKDFNGGAPWYEWGDCAEYNSEAVKDFSLTHSREIGIKQAIQDEALSQWLALKKYANGRGVEIIGDMPFYVSHDSVDVWQNKDLYSLNGYNPKLVAGVPPDYFSETGQLWGNPVYNWQNEGVYEKWSERIRNALRLFDKLRLDHFRAFDEYYAIPYGSKDATVGEWLSGPKFDFFKDKLSLPIIAEDLGIITDSVRELLAKTGYPGMRVLQFGFEGEGNPHAIGNIDANCVCYTGTHDNMPLKQFVTSFGEDRLKEELQMNDNAGVDDIIDRIIELGCATDAELFVVPLIDLMHCDAEYRINEPSTVSPLNWSSRVSGVDGLKDRILKLVKSYGRL